MAMMQAAVPVGPGVPRTLAEARAARVSALRYELRVTIPAMVTEPVTATEAIRFSLADTSTSLALDFSEPGDRISSLVVNGRNVPVQSVAGHVLLPATALMQGENEVRLAFTRRGRVAQSQSPSTSTRSSCRHARTWPSRASISRI